MKGSVAVVWIVPVLLIILLVSAASLLEPERELIAEDSGEETEENENNEESEEDSGIESISEFDGEDGTYEGTAEGYHDDVTLSVTVEDGAVAEIDVVSHEERDDLWEEVWDSLPERIIDEQSTDVDTVSGATWTSRAVLEAVLAALSSE